MIQYSNGEHRELIFESNDINFDINNYTYESADVICVKCETITPASIIINSKSDSKNVIYGLDGIIGNNQSIIQINKRGNSVLKSIKVD